MARKGKKRPIQVWGADLTNGERVNAGENGVVSVIVHGDRTITVTDVHNDEQVLLGADGEPVNWVGYVPRQN